MKKGQMEILGLAFVVLLIFVGIIFVIIFDINKPVSTQRTDFMYKQLSSNMINSIIHATTIDCNNNHIEDLMRDCALGETVECDNGEYSCTYVNNTILDIFNKTIDIWLPTGYVFNVTSELGVHTLIEKKNRFGEYCSTSMTGANSLFPIPLDPGYMYVNIYLCK